MASPRVTPPPTAIDPREGSESDPEANEATVRIPELMPSSGYNNEETTDSSPPGAEASDVAEREGLNGRGISEHIHVPEAQDVGLGSTSHDTVTVGGPAQEREDHPQGSDDERGDAQDASHETDLHPTDTREPVEGIFNAHPAPSSDVRRTRPATDVTTTIPAHVFDLGPVYDSFHRQTDILGHGPSAQRLSQELPPLPLEAHRSQQAEGPFSVTRLEDDLPPVPPRDRAGASYSGRRRSYRAHEDLDYNTEPVELPRWQPDADVSSCPICGTNFSFFVRKHHCRKCGRVVCNSCSPHRITIPYAYIVQPPPNRSSGVFLGQLLDDIHVSDSEDSYPGGESVRLCNPCVPDPNIDPPRQSPSRQPRPSRHSYGARIPDSIFGPLVLPGETRSGYANDAFDESLEHTMGAGAFAQASRYRSTSVRERHIPTYAHRASNSLANPSTGREATWTLGPQSASYGAQHRHRPRRHGDSFSATMPIDANSFYGFGPLQSRYGQSPNASGPSSRHRRTSDTYHPYGNSYRVQEPVEPIRITLEDFGDLVLTYTATARDSTPHDEAESSTAAESSEKGAPHPPTDEQQSECIICLEEFDVGTRVALMQCLCKFHASCLEDWWQIKPRCCPLHDHDK